MDGITHALINVASQMQTAHLGQAVHILVLKKAMDQQGVAMLSLLQSTTGQLPLATSGSLGTQVNVLV